MSSIDYPLYPVGQSPIEILPPELLFKILLSVSSTSEPCHPSSISQHLPIDPNTTLISSSCLLSCLLTSRAILRIGLPAMHRHLNITHSSTIINVLAQMQNSLLLDTPIRTLDFSKFQSTGPSSESIDFLDLLSQSPLLRHFRASNKIEAYLNSETIQKLFFGLPYIETLELPACNSPHFVNGCCAAVCGDHRVSQTLSSLKLAGCANLPPEFFEKLLHQLPRLQYLDVSNTQFNDNAIASIAVATKLTHLNISHCYALSGTRIVDFLTGHSSTNSLEYLNIETGSGIENQVLGEEDVGRLLRNMLSSLKVLNLKGSSMTSSHLPFLRILSTQLEEVCLGAHLRISEIEKLFFHPKSLDDLDLEPQELQEDGETMESKYQPVLNPMQEAIAICKLRQRINSTPGNPARYPQSSLKYLDISGLPVVEQCRLRVSVLLAPQSRPLEIIEIDERVTGSLRGLERVCGAVGWEVKRVGRRCWLRRDA